MLCLWRLLTPSPPLGALRQGLLCSALNNYLLNTYCVPGTDEGSRQSRLPISWGFSEGVIMNKSLPDREWCLEVLTGHGCEEWLCEVGETFREARLSKGGNWL